MDYDYLTKLRQHPTWRLLNADHAALMLSFFYHAFIQPNNRSMSQSELVSGLEDYLFQLREIHGEKRFPRAAQEYLDEWAGGEYAYLALGAKMRLAGPGQLAASRPEGRLSNSSFSGSGSRR